MSGRHRQGHLVELELSLSQMVLPQARRFVAVFRDVSERRRLETQLRERQEDLGPLTMFFLKRYSQELKKEVLGISKEAMGLLERYTWPGNVRELENVIERAVILCQGKVVTPQELPSLREHLRAPVLSSEAFRLPPSGLVLSDLEKELIRQALVQTHQNKSHAAKKLGLSRTQLRTRMRQYGLE